MRASFRVLTIAGLAVASACSRQANTGPRLDRTLLVPEQFANRGYNTAYDVVEAMRSNWLAERGPDSFASPAKVQVYFDGIAATARWGLDHGMGAIYVSTHPLSEMIGPANPSSGDAAAEAIGRS